MKPWTEKSYRSVPALIAAYRSGERPRLWFTNHAVRRRVDMGITEDEVFGCIAHPEEISYSPTHDAMNIKAGRITLGVQLDQSGYPQVGTMLYRYADEWERAAAEGRLGVGRVLYEDMSHLPRRS